MCLGDDVVLGPPSLSFTSTTRSQNRGAGGEDREKMGFFGGDNIAGSDNNLRDRFFKEREQRLKDKTNGAEPRRTKDEEGWSTAQRRRTGSNADEGGDRWNRLGDRDRDRPTRERDGADAPLRRNGIGRGKFEQAWRDDGAEGDPSRQNNRATGWRERDRDREWNRGGRPDDRIEEDPEWMSEGIEEKKQARTQEDFQKWKESMKSKITSPSAEEKPDPITSLQPLRKDEFTSTAKTTTPLDLDPSFGGLLGGWGSEKKADSQAKAAPLAAARGPSKFLKMFAKEEAPLPEPAAVELPANPIAASGLSSKEDQEGFQRILQLLGTSKSTPSVEAPASLQPPVEMEARESKRGITPSSDRGHMDLLTDVLARQGISNPAPRNPAPAAAPVSRFFPTTTPAVEAPAPFEPQSPPRNLPSKQPPEPERIVQPPLQDANRQFLLNLMRQTPVDRNAARNPPPEEPTRMPMANPMEQRNRGSASPDSPEFDPSAKNRMPMPPRMNVPPGFGLDEGGMMGLQQRASDNVMRQQMPTNMGVPSQMLPDWQKKAAQPPPFSQHLLGALGQQQQELINNNTKNGPPANMALPPGLRAPPGFPAPQGPGPQRQGMNPPNMNHLPPGMLPHRNGMPTPGSGGPMPGMFGNDGRPNLPPPMPHGMPPNFFSGGMPGMPPPGNHNGPPGFPGRDPREMLMMQQQQQHGQLGPGPMGPGRPGPGGPFPNFGGPMPDEMLRGRNAPPGFNGQ